MEQEKIVSLNADKYLRRALDISEKNKLIAEFMGLPKKVNGCITEGYMHPKVDVPVTTSGMQYKYSWDWLMPVVEKIEGLRDSNGNAYRFTIDMCNAQIEGTNIEILGGRFKLDTTYDAVVEFINQLNN